MLLTKREVAKRVADRKYFGELIRIAIARFTDRPLSKRPRLLRSNAKLDKAGEGVS